MQQDLRLEVPSLHEKIFRFKWKSFHFMKMEKLKKISYPVYSLTLLLCVSYTFDLGKN